MISWIKFKKIALRRMKKVRRPGNRIKFMGNFFLSESLFHQKIKTNTLIPSGDDMNSLKISRNTNVEYYTRLIDIWIEIKQIYEKT